MRSKKMPGKIEIYKSTTGTEISVQLDEETVWLTQKQMAQLFKKDTDTISLHLKNIYSSGELEEMATTEESSVVQKEGKREVKRKVKIYNLDAIISVGYRVNSKQGIQFRQWATQRLKDYLVQGYAINEKRLEQKQQQVEHLKTGIRILGRVIEEKMDDTNSALLSLFAKGLTLLDDYDHETLDTKGKTVKECTYPNVEEYLSMIEEMYSDFESDVFAKPKDKSFNSSVYQIAQSFGGDDLYPTLEEKAANLLYFIVKNHSFIDGNKRIAAACFIYFLNQNDVLINSDGDIIISNEALASLTLFIASSKSNEADIVKRLVVSVLNRALEG
jgi:death-on-curing family protein